MKKLLLSGVAGVAVIAAAPAIAADLRMPVKAAPAVAPAPYFSWSGCYVGAHVGWGWGKKDFKNGRTSYGDTTTSLVGGVDTSGGIFGGQLGCNYQWQPNFVIGIEGSAAGADINGFGPSITSSDPLHAKTDFLASITGRIGWTGWSPRVLLYFKGGAAWAHDRYWAFADTATASESRTGWTIGLGAEWALAFAPGWSAFVEWDHYDFGTQKAAFSFNSEHFGPYTSDVTQTIETVKIGVNYQFNLLLGKAPFVGRY